MDGSAIEDPSASGLAAPDPLLRAAPGPTRGGRSCERDRLTVAEPEAALW